MKKIRRCLAIIGALLLAGMYAVSIVLALTDDPGAMNAFRASLYCTVIVPVLIWAYTFIYRLLKNHYSWKDRDEAPADAADDEKDAES